MPSAKSWLEVSARALEQNLAALRQTATVALPPNTEKPALLAVIKANAYGHGATVCAPVLARAGAEWLGVTDAGEGAAVRHSLPTEHNPGILIMCGLGPADVPAILEHRLTPVVWFPEQLEWLAAHAKPAFPLPIHLEIDTGMARQGVLPGPDLDALLATLSTYPQLRLDGVMTHFASSEISNAALTHTQQQRFAQALAQLATARQTPTWLHAGNTSTVDEARLLPWLAAQAARLNARLLLRSGLALFGHALPLVGAAPRLAPSLTPAGTWKTRIIALTHLAPGATVGYNATFTAQTPMRVALLPVGYADGLRRELSSTSQTPGGWVMIRGERAPILGRVSMNLTTVDVTAIPAASLGEEATLLGPGITAEDHATLARTIPYEILCGMRANLIETA